MLDTEIGAISELSGAELDAVAAGWSRSVTQLSAFNLAIGIQVAPETNIALFSAGVIQGGVIQSQTVNSGNIA